MKEKIGRKVYDTEKSKSLHSNSYGNFGDPFGYEEVLYLKGKDEYFLLAQGGEKSPYPQGTILPFSFEEAVEWLKFKALVDNPSTILGEKKEKKEVKKVVKKEVKKAVKKPSSKTKK